MSPTIQNPAPAFTVTAFVEGALKEVSLSDYLGKWYIHALTPVILCILTILTRQF
jgi:alkyl hydroperoxide reductase subunit AhpC